MKVRPIKIEKEIAEFFCINCHEHYTEYELMKKFDKDEPCSNCNTAEYYHLKTMEPSPYNFTDCGQDSSFLSHECLVCERPICKWQRYKNGNGPR